MPDASPADIDRAVAAARQAFDDGPWPHMTPGRAGRGRSSGLSAALQARAQDIADIISSRERLAEAVVDHGPGLLGDDGARHLRRRSPRATSGSTTAHRRARRPGARAQRARRRRRRDHPVERAAVHHRAEARSGDGRRVPDRAEARARDAARLATCSPRRSSRPTCPPGVINIVPAGRENGEYLVQHPGVDKVSFTGSHRGRASTSARSAASSSSACTLELGGKSAAIVLDDVEARRRDARRARACRA